MRPKAAWRKGFRDTATNFSQNVPRPAGASRTGERRYSFFSSLSIRSASRALVAIAAQKPLDGVLDVARLEVLADLLQGVAEPFAPHDGERGRIERALDANRDLDRADLEDGAFGRRAAADLGVQRVVDAARPELDRSLALELQMRADELDVPAPGGAFGDVEASRELAEGRALVGRRLEAWQPPPLDRADDLADVDAAQDPVGHRQRRPCRRASRRSAVPKRRGPRARAQRCRGRRARRHPAASLSRGSIATPTSSRSAATARAAAAAVERQVPPAPPP